ncbi:MAG: hypothetical protein STSR0001_20320 [Methanothrix sp.]
MKFEDQVLAQIELVLMGNLHELVAIEFLIVHFVDVSPLGSKENQAGILAEDGPVHALLRRVHEEEGIMDLAEGEHLSLLIFPAISQARSFPA